MKEENSEDTDGVVAGGQEQQEDQEQNLRLLESEAGDARTDGGDVDSDVEQLHELQNKIETLSRELRRVESERMALARTNFANREGVDQAKQIVQLEDQLLVMKKHREHMQSEIGRLSEENKRLSIVREKRDAKVVTDRVEQRDVQIQQMPPPPQPFHTGAFAFQQCPTICSPNFARPARRRSSAVVKYMSKYEWALKAKIAFDVGAIIALCYLAWFFVFSDACGC